jgi:enoyl reductase-like protein
MVAAKPTNPFSLTVRNQVVACSSTAGFTQSTAGGVSIDHDWMCTAVRLAVSALS